MNKRLRKMRRRMATDTAPRPHAKEQPKRREAWAMTQQLYLRKMSKPIEPEKQPDVTEAEVRRVLEQVDQAAKQCADIINALPCNTAMFECLRRLQVNTVGRIEFDPPDVREAWMTELRDKVLADLAMADLTFGPPAGHA